MTGVGLAARFDGVVCDLDGVVYAGPGAIEHAADALNALTIPVVFATNNASRSPHDVGEHLRRLGLRACDEAVLTSSLAAARILARDLPSGSRVMAVGGPGVAEALRAVGLHPLTPGADGPPAAVLQGYGAEVTAAELGEAAHAIRAGARWVATNDDPTLPTESGPAPGNGALVAAVRLAVDVDPEVVGKPHPPMYEMAAEVLGAHPARVIAVGDRLGTDIRGAVATGMAGVLVLTGVHGPADAAAAPVDRRPDYVVKDLRGLHEHYPEAQREGDWCVRGGARARVAEGRLSVDGDGMDAIRASLDAVWAAADGGQLRREDTGRLLTNG
ncbi:hydrolase [Janibacter sp. Soil728]|uniref:HAD-IIA family hydrolase n=1 Tax=Janibacter sp. Soil728 TaxID=1736393 RepID=UPI0006FD720F|nr:HAD-IIA family hydrolase [Janibacter sp. Soil728]KRE37243.1 hydrolase [Janibacter sp. Soil728]